MLKYPADIYTEPSPDTDTCRQLGPLQPMAGVWEGTKGADEHPFANGDEQDTFVERYELQPIDPQTNGPQLFYGLRYHTHIVKPGEVETFHDQVGYWLWEPAASTVIMTLAIPRGIITMASGSAKADSTTFELTAAEGSATYGICSNPFLQDTFRTVRFSIIVTINPDGTWSYDEDTIMEVRGRDGVVHHTDRNTLTRIAEPTPNPLAARSQNWL
ncbi:MAG: FABP family protein [Acidimicrobiales bacterium]